MLKYIGNDRYIVGVPARDLTDEEVQEHGGEKKLIESGLYAKPDKNPKRSEAAKAVTEVSE